MMSNDDTAHCHMACVAGVTDATVEHAGRYLIIAITGHAHAYAVKLAMSAGHEGTSGAYIDGGLLVAPIHGDCRGREEAYTLNIDGSTCIRVHVYITVLACAAAVWSELVVLSPMDTVCWDRQCGGVASTTVPLHPGHHSIHTHQQSAVTGYCRYCGDDPSNREFSRCCHCKGTSF